MSGLLKLQSESGADLGKIFDFGLTTIEEAGKTPGKIKNTKSCNFTSVNSILSLIHI